MHKCNARKKKVGSREREEQGREFSLWPNVLFHPRIPWSPSSPHVVQPACALACAKAQARGRSARTPAADDVFSGRGYISSLPSAALNSFHVGRFSACARPTQRSSASCLMLTQDEHQQQQQVRFGAERQAFHYSRVGEITLQMHLVTVTLLQLYSYSEVTLLKT